MTSPTAPPLSGSRKPPYRAKHLAVAPTLLTTSRAELISCGGGGWRPAARAASTSEVISGHATGLNANTQKKNKKGTKKRRKTSEGRHGGYRRISLVYTLVSGGGGRGRSSWPRPLPAQRPLVDPGLPTCLTSSSSSPPFTPRVLASFFPTALLRCPITSCSFPFLLKSTTAANNNFIYTSFL